MKRLLIDPKVARTALRKLPEVAAQESLEPPELSEVYIPSGHQRALSLDSVIVVGMRGAGKSLWTAVLSSDKHRAYVATVAGLPKLAELKVRVGFGLDESNSQFPTEHVLAQLVESGADPVQIWQTVVLRHALQVSGGTLPFTQSWQKAVDWVRKNQEQADALLSDCDATLREIDSVLLVVYDALDRLAADWAGVRKLLIGALRFSLKCRSKRAIKMKFFLRPDMEEDLEIWKFPDSSKLRHSRVELDWRTIYLYGLVLLHLANTKGSGPLFREALKKQLAVEWEEREGVYPVPQELRSNERKVRAVIESIAGEWVGRSAKRGFTYTWVPTHLADAAGRISPRSLILAFRRAAEVTEELYPNHDVALHFEAIQQGVAAASEIRIGEIKEDYPWVDPLLSAARGLTVPCDPEELTSRWLSRQLKEVKEAGDKLPPRRFTVDPARSGKPEVLIDDLVELAVLYRTEDDRINMPDIFRVGFGIRRKGGVRPPR